MEKRIFYGSGKTSVQAFLAEIPLELRQTAKKIFWENFRSEQILEITPWFSQEIDERKIDLLLLQAKHFKKIDISIDELYAKANSFGLCPFSQEIYEKIDFSLYRPLPNEKIPIVVCMANTEWKKEVRVGYRSSGDEFDGPFNYDYYSKTLPTILSATERGTKLLEKDTTYVDPDYLNRLAPETYFLFYAPQEELITEEVLA